MQIVIDISKKLYEDIQKRSTEIQAAGYLLENAVLNGIPLPKRHGKLKDEDEIIKAIEDRVEFLRKNDAIFMRLRKDIDILGCIPKIRCAVPTIIEENKESEVMG